MPECWCAPALRERAGLVAVAQPRTCPGEVIEVNTNLNDDPSLVNSAAEGDGWMTKVPSHRPNSQPEPQPLAPTRAPTPSPSPEPQPLSRNLHQVKLSDASELDGLMDEAAYKAFCAE